MSLNPPRRIFARKRRLAQLTAALRPVAILVFGFTAAFGATLVAARWPDEPHVSRIQLPAVSDMTVLRAGEPVMRMAVATPGRQPDAGETARESGHETSHLPQ